MKIQKECIAFILLIQLVLSHEPEEKLPAVFFINEVARWAEDYWEYVRTGDQITSKLSQRFGDMCSKEKLYTNAITRRVIQEIPDISEELSRISQFVTNRSANFVDAMDKLGLDLTIRNRVAPLLEKMDLIDIRFKELTDSVTAQRAKKFNGKEFCSFASRQIYGDDLLSARVDAMYRIINPSHRLQKSWIKEIYENLELHKDALCDVGYSPLEYLYSMYISVMLAEIKAYVMAVFSHNSLFNFNGTGLHCHYDKDPNSEISNAQKNLREHIKYHNSEFLKIMKMVSKEFRACDQGKDFIRDVTFFELEGAIQAIVTQKWLPVNDDSPFPNNVTSSWYGFCPTNPKIFPNICRQSMARPCRGHITRCYTEATYMDGCLESKSSSRRYQFLRERGYWGKPKPSNCPEDKKMIVPDATNCDCLDNAVDSVSTHVFNLQWVESDVSKNMVITGVRFIVNHRIMQLQIQQGKLGTHFQVDEADWKPVNDTSEEIRAARLKKKLRGVWPDLVENRDYLVLGQENNRINFDTLVVPHSHVLTGVRFYYPTEKTGLGEGIQIAIKSTEFNPATGELYEDKSQITTSKILHEDWYSYDSTATTGARFPTKEATSPGQYTLIQRSDMGSDSGQTTLPYFDALPLVSNPPAPLGGLGIFHKTHIPYSFMIPPHPFVGFISLKFVSLDYPTYMEKSAAEFRN